MDWVIALIDPLAADRPNMKDSVFRICLSKAANKVSLGLHPMCTQRP